MTFWLNFCECQREPFIGVSHDVNIPYHRHDSHLFRKVVWNTTQKIWWYKFTRFR